VTLASPPRLKDGELGAIVRSAAGAGMSTERLERNGSRIKAAIAAGAKATRWKLLLGLICSGVLAIAVLAFVVPRGDRDDARAPAPASAEVPRAVAADAALAAPADAAEISSRPRRPSSRRTAAPPRA
jgi:hypothetical protein